MFKESKNVQVVLKPSHRFKSLEPHYEGEIMRDFTIHSNTNRLGLRPNVIKDLCPLILYLRHSLMERLGQSRLEMEANL